MTRRRLRGPAFVLALTLALPAPFAVPVLAQRAPAAPAAGERRIVLEGARNFRDLGGYPTADGRHVRWGRIYRSGELSRLTPADYQTIATLGIAVVCDFRRDSERANASTTWQGANAPTILNLPGAQVDRAPAGVGGGRGAARGAGGAAPATTADGLSPLLASSYPQYATTLAESYRETMRQIRTQNGAVLYHCTAGKDRTGSFSALLLTMLGVPRDIVMQDYLLSNEYVVSQARIDAVVARGGTRRTALATMGVDSAYLDALFRSIDERYGSFDNYRRTALGVSDAELVALRNRLLE